MRRITVVTIAAALATACHPARIGRPRTAADRPVSVAATLDCPDHVGQLSLARRAADGASCSYGGQDGAQVTLTRMALIGGSPSATLADLDAQARAAAPAAPHDSSTAATTTTTETSGASRTTVTSSSRSSDGAIPPTPPVPPVPTIPGDGEHVRLDLPGLHIDADGDHARVNGFGQHVEADGDRAVVSGNAAGLHTSVVSDDDGTLVRTGGVGSRSLDASLILAANAAGPDGWRSAGYVARGPLDGPLVVAQVQTRGDHSGGGADPFNAARRLVDRNTRR